MRPIDYIRLLELAVLSLLAERPKADATIASVEVSTQNLSPFTLHRIIKEEREIRNNADKIMREAEKWVQQKQREGWTKADFVMGLKQFLEEPNDPSHQ